MGVKVRGWGKCWKLGIENIVEVRDFLRGCKQHEKAKSFYFCHQDKQRRYHDTSLRTYHYAGVFVAAGLWTFSQVWGNATD